MSVRASPAVRPNILKIIESFRSSMVLELQQRGAEYSTLLSSQWDRLRGDLLGKMPVLDEATLRKRRAVLDENGGGADMMPSQEGGFGGSPSKSVPETPVGAPQAHAPANAASGGGSFLLDLDDIFGGGATVPATPPTANGFGHSQSSGGDLLSDIFSMGAAPTIPTQPAQQMPDSVMGMMPPAPPTNPVVNAFDKNGLSILLELSKPSPATPANTHILCKFSNNTRSPMSNIVFQAAVPKFLKLEMLPPSSTTIPPMSSGAVTQDIRLTNSMQGEKNIMLKLKLSYTFNGQNVEELVQVSSFPPLY